MIKSTWKREAEHVSTDQQVNVSSQAHNNAERRCDFADKSGRDVVVDNHLCWRPAAVESEETCVSRNNGKIDSS
jgi:hypothetical protein